MLSELTQIAIDVLYDIHAGGISYRTLRYDITPEAYAVVLRKLHDGGLIRPKATTDPDIVLPYELTHSYVEISLLQILEAMGEHLNCNHPADEKLYQGNRQVASRLGIINHITRLYLSEIKLTDF